MSYDLGYIRVRSTSTDNSANSGIKAYIMTRFITGQTSKPITNLPPLGAMIACERLLENPQTRLRVASMMGITVYYEEGRAQPWLPGVRSYLPTTQQLADSYRSEPALLSCMQSRGLNGEMSRTLIVPERGLVVIDPVTKSLKEIRGELSEALRAGDDYMDPFIRNSDGTPAGEYREFAKLADLARAGKTSIDLERMPEFEDIFAYLTGEDIFPDSKVPIRTMRIDDDDLTGSELALAVVGRQYSRPTFVAIHPNSVRRLGFRAVLERGPEYTQVDEDRLRSALEK